MDKKSLIIGILSATLACLLVYIFYLSEVMNIYKVENAYSRQYISILADTMAQHQAALQVVLNAQQDQDRALKISLEYQKQIASLSGK